MELMLRNERVALRLAPEAGGSIAGFALDGEAVMRAAEPGAVPARDPLRLACFPLVPYSNRIRGGRFAFRGETVALPLNYPPERHSIHGLGWQAPWSIVEAGETRATLAFDHGGGAWPWAFRALQRFELLERGIGVRLSIENRSDRTMPAGLGLHPYYARTPGMQLRARLDGWWETDAEIMPVRHHATAPADDWTPWLHGRRTTDNVFSGWNGTADLLWPEHKRRLRMTASPLARNLVVYAPTDLPVAVVEPVTHPTDALNAPGQPGILALEPGDTAELDVRFEVSAL